MIHSVIGHIEFNPQAPRQDLFGGRRSGTERAGGAGGANLVPELSCLFIYRIESINQSIHQFNPSIRPSVHPLLAIELVVPCMVLEYRTVQDTRYRTLPRTTYVVRNHCPAPFDPADTQRLSRIPAVTSDDYVVLPSSPSSAIWLLLPQSPIQPSRTNVLLVSPRLLAVRYASNPAWRIVAAS
jgi:uncharacterized protein (DUF2384 family)